jgi:hypothetical protein
VNQHRHQPLLLVEDQRAFLAKACRNPYRLKVMRQPDRSPSEGRSG